MIDKMGIYVCPTRDCRAASLRPGECPTHGHVLRREVYRRGEDKLEETLGKMTGLFGGTGKPDAAESIKQAGERAKRAGERK